jgi:uncharacterized protein (DUF885 family)
MHVDMMARYSSKAGSLSACWHKAHILLFGTVIGVLMIGCQQAASPPPPTNAEVPVARADQAAATDPDWDRFAAGFVEDYLRAHPAFAAAAGRREYDGMLPDWSAAGIRDEIDRLHGARDRAAAFSAAQLGPTGQYQREYLLAVTDRALFWLEKAQWPLVNPAFYFDDSGDSLDPGLYINADDAPLAERMQSYTRYAQSIPRVADQIRANLHRPMARTRLEYGISKFSALADFLANGMPAAFAAVDAQPLRTEFLRANRAAVAALRQLTAWLESRRAVANEDFSLGAELLRQMLHDTQRVDSNLDDLASLGWQDLHRNQLALGEACAEFAPGATVHKCLARMASRKPAGGLLAAARRQLPELRQFLQASDLVSIPDGEQVRVTASPSQALFPFAYMDLPGAFARERPAVYHLAPPDPRWAAKRQQAYLPAEASLLFTSVHEVWPGRLLSFLHARRSAWLPGQLFVNPAFSGGWGHYCEELVLEAGLRDGSAEARIGQLSRALLNDARFLSAIGLHRGSLSLADAQRLFMEEAYLDEGAARLQAARGTYEPDYLDEMLGKLMIRQLRKDWTHGHGGREAWRAFHDTLLSLGGAPIALLRAQMMGRDGY